MIAPLSSAVLIASVQPRAMRWRYYLAAQRLASVALLHAVCGAKSTARGGWAAYFAMCIFFQFTLNFLEVALLQKN